MVDMRVMTSSDAAALQSLMASEEPSYLAHFTAFSEADSLVRQCGEARRDAFFTLLEGNRPGGFFCLRGLDQGYARPSFGVYVASTVQGRGLARTALQAAQQWCREQEIQVLMLKVAPDNERARNLYEAFGFEVIGRCPDSGQTVMEMKVY